MKITPRPRSTTVWKVSKYGVSLRIQSEFRKIWTRKNSVFGHFSRSAPYNVILIFWIKSKQLSNTPTYIPFNKMSFSIRLIIDYMFWSYHVLVSEWIHTLYLPECQGTPCSSQARNLKFKWLQLDSNPEPLSR